MQPNPAKNLAFSFIRTIVPLIVTWVIGFVTDNFGPLVDDSTRTELTLIVYGLAFGLYYLVVRLIETYVTPRISFLLGDFRRGFTEPVYPDAVETTVVPPAVERVEADA